MSLRTAGNGAAAERIFGHSVTTNYFTVLGTVPFAGRLFGAESDRPGVEPGRRPESPLLDPPVQPGPGSHRPVDSAQRSAVHRHRRGAGRIPGHRHRRRRCVGSAGERGGTAQESIFTNRNGGWLVMGGRLKPGVALAQAAAELEALGDRARSRVPDDAAGRSQTAAAAVVARAGQHHDCQRLRRAADDDRDDRAHRRVREYRRHAAGSCVGAAAGNRRAAGDRRGTRAADPAAAHRNRDAVRTRRNCRSGSGSRADVGASSRCCPRCRCRSASRCHSTDASSRLRSGLSLVAAVLSGLAPALQASKADVVTALKDDAPGGVRAIAGAALVRHRPGRVQPPARRRRRHCSCGRSSRPAR